MREWLAPSFSPQPQSFEAVVRPVLRTPSQQRLTASQLARRELETSVAVCRVKPTVNHDGFLMRASPIPGLNENRCETSDHKLVLPAGDTHSGVNRMPPKFVHPKTSREQPTVLGSPVALGAAIRPVPQRSASTWEVSDIDVQAGRKGDSTATDAHGAASLRDASTVFGATASPLYAGARAEVDLLETWFKDLVTPSATARQPPRLDVLASCHRELDPCTGKFRPAPEYPETLQSAVQGPCRDQRDIGWRQMNMTSELQIVRELRSRQKLAEHLLASRKQSEQVAASTAALAHEASSWPNAHCTLRPALPEDFSQIADIINLEAATAALPQMFDSKVFDSTDVDEIYRRCQKNMRPFIVAVPIEEDMMDRSKWPLNSERVYREYVEFKKNRPSPSPPVVGFALVTEIRLGFPQARCPGSRYSAQMRVVVHPEYRQMSYGTALMDRILLSVSPRHRNIIDYDWECASPAHIYEDPVDQNDRQYARIYVEVFCASKEQAEYTWRAELLGKFNFQEVAHLRNIAKTDQGHRSKWLDLVLWEFEALETSGIWEVAE